MAFSIVNLCLVLGLLNECSGNEKGETSLLARMIDRSVERPADQQLTEQIKSELCSATPKLGRLFHVRSPAGRYKYDLDEARHACAEQGATLASYHQLYEAWQDGLDYCACGWLSDGTARYPTQISRRGCGGVGINDCEWLTQYDAWCFRALSFCD
ncbi:PREDICTED: hyaluronan and proteoglycan link protein 3-like [Branchiostoma belcheri]|uniref:Hyaluronan and proteoglycan link protein 3-like n=1 Tax=Branchiostoma belcheri TaxID=7741 RepID=A0A6P5AI04_BRABE|nr:PREDICTED: hyaluronan and proteoglycan link protein 3-like [Branchiostoma belcheri]